MEKKIKFAPIALRKLAARRLSQLSVKTALLDPDQMVEGYGGGKVAQRIVSVRNKKKLLRVVYEETKTEYLVITAYVTSRIRALRGEMP